MKRLAFFLCLILRLSQLSQCHPHSVSKPSMKDSLLSFPVTERPVASYKSQQLQARAGDYPDGFILRQTVDGSNQGRIYIIQENSNLYALKVFFRPCDYHAESGALRLLKNQPNIVQIVDYGEGDPNTVQDIPAYDGVFESPATIAGPNAWIMEQYLNLGDMRHMVKEYKENMCTIPPAFLVHVLEELARAYRAMRYSTRYVVKLADPQWMLHTERLDQYMVDVFSDDLPTEYPQVILQDLGLPGFIDQAQASEAEKDLGFTGSIKTMIDGFLQMAKPDFGSQQFYTWLSSALDQIRHNEVITVGDLDGVVAQLAAQGQPYKALIPEFLERPLESMQ